MTTTIHPQVIETVTIRIKQIGPQGVGGAVTQPVNHITFNTSPAGVPSDQGTMSWNISEETLDLILNGAVLQIGQEIHYHVRNDTASEITDGTPVMAVGTLGASGLIQIAPMNGTVPSLAKFLLGVTTQTISAGENGKIAYLGKVRGIDTTGTLSFGGLETWSDGDVLYIDPFNIGFLTNVEPDPPYIYMPVAFAVFSNASNGVLSVRVTPLDESILRTSRTALTTYSALPDRNAQESIHGNLDLIVAGIDPDAGDVIISNAFGQGKMVIVNNGVAETGVLRVTGTSIDRDTGAETALDTELITIDTTTIDNNSTDANSQPTWDLENAFMSDKWWTGTVNITLHEESGALTDLDIYQCSYDQFGDARSINIRILDMTIQALNTNGSISAHAYTVQVTGSRVNIQQIPDTEVVRTADFETDKWYRIRRGALDVPLNGLTDGMFLNMSFLGSPAKFANATIKVWADVSP